MAVTATPASGSPWAVLRVEAEMAECRWPIGICLLKKEVVIEAGSIPEEGLVGRAFLEDEEEG